MGYCDNSVREKDWRCRKRAMQMTRVRQRQSFEHMHTYCLRTPVILTQQCAFEYRRVPKFWTYGSVCCACAQRPGLPRASPSRACRGHKNIFFQYRWIQNLGIPPVSCVCSFIVLQLIRFAATAMLAGHGAGMSVQRSHTGTQTQDVVSVSCISAASFAVLVGMFGVAAG
jgi:hypothetical protein